MIAKDQAALQAQTRALEDKAVADATAHLKSVVAQVAQQASTGWLTAFGSVDAPADNKAALDGLTATLKAHLALANTDVAPVLRDAVRAAQALGAQQAAKQLDEPVELPQPTVSAKTDKAIKAAGTKAAGHLSRADNLLDGLDEGAEFDDLYSAVSTAQQSVNAVSMATGYLVNQASAHGVTAVTKAAGIGQVFIGERDACLTCNAFVGKTSADGFDEPPLHPHCRCSLAPWSPDWAEEGEVSYPQTLQREAERSVLKGWSSSDSERQRLKAADKLLQAGTDLPASVQKAATKAVKKGTFAKIGKVPALTK